MTFSQVLQFLSEVITVTTSLSAFSNTIIFFRTNKQTTYHLSQHLHCKHLSCIFTRNLSNQEHLNISNNTVKYLVSQSMKFPLKHHNTCFLLVRCYASAVFATATCLSVCLSHAGIVPSRAKAGS